MRFQVLGPLQVVGAGGELVQLAGQRQRKILAVLLLTPNRLVDLRLLVDALWEDHPPTTAKRQIQNCVSALRRKLIGDGGSEHSIVADGTGYLIRVRDGELDSQSFRDLVAFGHALMSAGDAGWAVDTFRAALRLWQGAALAGLTGRVIQAGATRLDEERLATLECCVDLELGLGRHHELIGELSEVVASYPLRERPVGQLMVALHRSGRQADALQEYRRLRARLAEDLGVDPSSKLHELHIAILRNDADGRSDADARTDPAATVHASAQPVVSASGDRRQLNRLPRNADPTGGEGPAGESPQHSVRVVVDNPSRERMHRERMVTLYRSGRVSEALTVFRDLYGRLADEQSREPDGELSALHEACLRGDPRLGLPAPPEAPPGRAPIGALAPSQLPRDPSDFTGRTREVAELGRELTATGGPAVPVVSVVGKAGVGKTALAVHAAHLLRSEFPDGQLYADLRGTAGPPTEPGTALNGFLHALGVPAPSVPADPDERAKLYRSLLSGRRVLVVLDDAASEAQVRRCCPVSRRPRRS